MNKKLKLSDSQVAEVLAATSDPENQATVASEARRLGVSRTTLRDSITRFEREATRREAPGVEADPDGALTITSPPETIGGVALTEEGLMRHYGLDPAEHEIVRKRLNFWGSDAAPNFQLRLDAIPKSLLVLPETRGPEDWLPAPQPAVREDGGRRIVIVTDYHAPLHARGLHQTSLQFMADFEPSLLLNLGDLADFTSVSQHRPRPRMVQHVNDCIVEGGSILRDQRRVLPDAEMVLLPGNHDDRIQHAIIDNNRNLLGVRGFSDEYDALDLRRLWDLDPIHVNMIDEDWDRAKFHVNDKLSAIHGKNTTKTAGEAMLNKLVRSVVQGHSHRMRFTYRTQHDDPVNDIRTRVAVECGTMAQLSESLGYGDEENWQQGFVYGTVWPDGQFALSPAMFVANTLLLPDGTRYKATVDELGREL